MVRIGDCFYVSSVESIPAERRQPGGVGGIGHIFKMDASGRLLAAITVGEGEMYHPGGIDYDGRHIWVSVGEYRPDSRSIIYRIDPATLQAEEVFRYEDHIGAIVHDHDEGVLHGLSWGSRYFYRWPLDRNGRVRNAGTPREILRRENPAHYIAYQDGQYVGGHFMVCSGLGNYRKKGADRPFFLGGIELVDLKTGRPVRQVPFDHWTEGGLPMTQNPFWLEATEKGLRAYFMPEDDRSTLYVYETK